MYRRWAPYGIRVNSLSPGYMKTDLIMNLLEKEGKELVENWLKDIPMGRMAHPSELQGTVVWMASDASSYLTGSDVVCSFLNFCLVLRKVLTRYRSLMGGIRAGDAVEVLDLIMIEAVDSFRCHAGVRLGLSC
jgi:NAD(P)-dependent dehydrogenase (short-subunit alcohol dehydrogenase family)